MSGIHIRLGALVRRTYRRARAAVPAIRYRLSLTGEQILIVLSLLFFLSVVVLLPVLAMVLYSFNREFPTFTEFGFTLEHYVNLFADRAFLIETTMDTFVYAVGSSLLGISIGTVIVLFVIKYAPRHNESRIRAMMLLPYSIPAVSSLVGWTYLLGGGGPVNRFLMEVFNLSNAPIDIYSMWGMIWVEGIHTAPLAFLFLYPAVKSIPSEMDNASFIARASKFQTIRYVLLPVIWPSFLSTLIFMVSRTMATVATPSVLGVPDRIFTFGSVIPFFFLSGADLQFEIALAFSVIMTAISAVFIVIYLRVQRRADRYTTVAGRGGSESKKFDTTRFGLNGGYTFVGLYLFVAGILPLVVIIWASLQSAGTLGLSLDFTFENYVALYENTANGVGNFRRAFTNTILLGLAVPTVAMLVTHLIAHMNQSIEVPFGDLLEFIASFPLAIPGIARGLGFLAALILTPVYGTIWILFIGYAGLIVPVAIRYSSPAMTKIGIENTQSAIISGDTVLGAYRRVTLRLTSQDFLSGWIHTFMMTVRDVSIPILLYAVGSEVLSVELLFSMQAGYGRVAASIAVILAVVSLIPYLVLIRLERRQLSVRT